MPTKIDSRPPCLCGCGGFPKGPTSRFLPGHDARYYSAQKKAAAGPAPVQVASIIRDTKRDSGRQRSRAL